jgi:two-component system KDP operon response regulator KdpE
VDVEGKKILIVDDDHDMCKVVEEIFNASGARVYTAHNGEKGLRALYLHRPDLVLLDIIMPGMDGNETLQRIRQLSDVPVIMLTALDSQKEIERSLYGGADDYVTKPFKNRELLARATAALRRAAMSPLTANENIFEDGYLYIDPSARRVARQGKLVSLTPTEFALLAYLVENAGQVCTFGEIMQGVWGDPLRSNVRALQTFIYQLRQKLEPDPRNPKYLLKERSVGYRFGG